MSLFVLFEGNNLQHLVDVNFEWRNADVRWEHLREVQSLMYFHICAMKYLILKHVVVKREQYPIITGILEGCVIIGYDKVPWKTIFETETAEATDGK